MPTDLPPASDEIVIVAPLLPPAAGDMAFSRIVLTEEELRDALRVDEALRQAPGASLFRRTSSLTANATTQGVSLRAIAPSGAGRALVTLDGAPLNDPFGNWVIWSQLQPESIEAVEIIRGAGAGPYGAGALTGVVALRETTRPADPVAVEAYGGERGAARIAARAYPALGVGRLALSASAEHFDGFIPVRASQRGDADVPAGYESASASARWAAPLNWADASVRLGLYREERGAGVEGAESQSEGALLSAAFAQRNARAGGWRVQGWAHQSSFENRASAVSADRDTATPANDQYDVPALGLGLNAAWRGGGDGLLWELGADARWADGETNERFTWSAPLSRFTRHRTAGGQSNVAGLYAEASLSRAPWMITGGVRLDRWSASDGERIETNTVTSAVLIDAEVEDRDGVLPTARFGLWRDLGGGVHARAAAYAGFRAPSLNELHRPFRVGNDITEANPWLDPERLYGAEFGFDGVHGGVRWSLGAFYNEIRDPIANVTILQGAGASVNVPLFDPGTVTVFVPVGGVLRQRRNIGAIEAVGLEGEARWAMSNWLDMRAAFSATDARVDGGADAPDLDGNRPAQAPIWTVTAGAVWRPSPVVTLAADLRWESGRWEDDLNSRRLAEGGTLDLRGAFRLTDRVTLTTRLDNAFDSELETAETGDGVESLAPPRQFWLGLAFR